MPVLCLQRSAVNCVDFQRHEWMSVRRAAGSSSSGGADSQSAASTSTLVSQDDDSNDNDISAFYNANKQAFNLKGKKLYNVDGLNLIDPKTKKVVGHLSPPGGPNTRAADHLFTTENN